MLAFALPPLPVSEPDAAANDRFDLRLTRANLAVVHRSALPFHGRNIAQRSLKVAFDRVQVLNGAGQ